MFSAYSAAFQRRLPPSPPLGPQDFSVPPVPTSVFAGPPPHTRCVGGRARPPHVWLPAQREGVAPALARSPLPMPAPACTLGREGEILLLWKSWGGGVPTSAARSGVQASPFASAGAAAALAGGGSSPGPPPSRQDGATPAGCCLHCWAHRRGSLSSSALVWCLEPGPASALLNRDLGLANAPRCASVSPGLGGGSHMPSPPQRQMLCACAAPACACPHLPSPLWGGMGLI